MAKDNIMSKQPNEEYTIQGDFSKVVASGETINVNTSTVTAVDNAGADATSTVIDDGSLALATAVRGLTAKVKGGTVAGSPYTITFVCKTNAGNTWEINIEMAIFDN